MGPGAITSIFGLRLLDVSPPFLGLSRIINVLAPVGLQERNDPDDVRVVQNLLRAMWIHHSYAVSFGIPQVTGRFDLATGFWIFHSQAMFGDPRAEIDGVVSPAHKGSFHGGIPWIIAILNLRASTNNPTVYKRFVTAMEGGIANPLRREFGFS